VCCTTRLNNWWQNSRIDRICFLQFIMRTIAPQEMFKELQHNLNRQVCWWKIMCAFVCSAKWGTFKRKILYLLNAMASLFKSLENQLLWHRCWCSWLATSKLLVWAWSITVFPGIYLHDIFRHLFYLYLSQIDAFQHMQHFVQGMQQQAQHAIAADDQQHKLELHKLMAR